MAQQTDMPFWVWAQVGPKNHVFDGVQMLHEGAILSGGMAGYHCKSLGHSGVSSAETALGIEMQFGMLSREVSENLALGGGACWCHLANTIKPYVCGGDEGLV